MKFNKTILILGITLFTIPLLLNYKKKYPILVQGAMDEELNLLILELKNKEKIKIGNFTFWKGNIENYPVILSRTEIGMVNVSSATTIAIEKFNPKVIINQGTAGGHSKDVFAKDIVIANKVFNIGAYIIDYQEKNKGINPLNWKPLFMVTTIRDENDKKIEYQYFNSSPNLIAIAKKISNKYKYGKVHIGPIGSADQWNREIDRLEWLNETYGTLAEEMEGSAVAQIATSFKIPFIDFRVITNSDVNHQKYDVKIANYGQEFTLLYLKELIKNIKNN